MLAYEKIDFLILCATSYHACPTPATPARTRLKTGTTLVKIFLYKQLVQLLLLLLLLLLLQEGRGGGGPRRAQNQISGKLGLDISNSGGGGAQIIPMLGLSATLI